MALGELRTAPRDGTEVAAHRLVAGHKAVGVVGRARQVSRRMHAATAGRPTNLLVAPRHMADAVALDLRIIPEADPSRWLAVL